MTKKQAVSNTVKILRENSNLTDKKTAKKFLEDLFKLVEQKIISDPKISQKISLYYEQKFLDTVNQLSNTFDESSKI